MTITPVSQRDSKENSKASTFHQNVAKETPVDFTDLLFAIAIPNDDYED